MKGDLLVAWCRAYEGNPYGVAPGVYMSAADLLAALDAGLGAEKLRAGIAATLDEALAADDLAER